MLKTTMCLEYMYVLLVQFNTSKMSTQAGSRVMRVISASSTHELSRYSARAVCRIMYDVHNTSDIYMIELYVGWHGSGWLYVLGMPLRGYLPIFVPLNAQSTSHGPRPEPTLAPRCLDGSLPAQEPKARKTASGWKRKRCRCAKYKIFLHINIWRYPIPCTLYEV